MNIVRYPECISSSELVLLVLGIHIKVMLTDDSELRRRITVYSRYCLECMSLTKLQVNWDGWSRDERIPQYETMPLHSMPPIVLGCVYPKEHGHYTYDVIDGHHRAVATKRRGELFIRAYVPEVGVEV